MAVRRTEPVEPLVLDLDDARARDPAMCGGKAANLARARQGGLPAQPGFVITTACDALLRQAGDPLPPMALEEARQHWHRLTGGGARPVVVRSSSTVEDAEVSSMAGQFRSVLDVRGWDSFLQAVGEVSESAVRLAGDAPGGPAALDPTSRPMAVLVQPFLRPDCGGVLFGVDPVTGESGNVVVEAVAGGPESLVSGRVAAQHYVISTRGRLRSVDHRSPREHRHTAGHARLLDRHHLHALAELSRLAVSTFGAPQDIEWAFDRSGTLWLLQSRPVTATGQSAAATGPVLGPGPVAETFPDPLRPLEVDLWVRPLSQGIRDAFRVTRAVPPERLASSPVVTVVDGRVAADLALFGYVGRHGTGWRVLDPRVGVRRLHAAWQVGWLRATLPQQVASTVADVDARLAAVPELETLSDGDLAALLEAAQPLLRRLHRDEVFAGTLLPGEAGGQPGGQRTAAAIALGALARGRSLGHDDDEVVRGSPVVLALTPPRIGTGTPLPPSGRLGSVLLERSGVADLLDAREALRLRARWVQELTARAAGLVGRRWAGRGVVEVPDQVALLSCEELAAVAAGRADIPRDLAERAERAAAQREEPPLPAQFRLTPDGTVVPAGRGRSGDGMGVGAGGGRGAGTVCHGSLADPPHQGDVLVVRSLDPSFATWLPGLSGLVSETGSTLSHLAILAREFGVPTVVAVPDALTRLPVGSRVLVDGTTGEIARLDGGAAAAPEVSA